MRHHTDQDRLGRGGQSRLGNGQDRPQDGLDRLTVAEAAERLGVTQDAVRKRMARGTIRHARGEDGRIYVYLDAFEEASKTVQNDGQDRTSKTVQDGDQDRYVESLEDQIRFLRQELERKDALLLNMTEAMKALGPAQEPRDGRETATGDAEGSKPRPATGGAQEAAEPRASWWRRWFGFE